jgi:hypothetical protein
MAGYREKSATDLAWDRIRRRITRELDIQIAEKRAEALNILLANAWRRYAVGLTEGRIEELESRYAALVDTIIGDIVPQTHGVLGEELAEVAR